MVSLEGGGRTVLVTGARGFLGRALVRELEAAGYRVRRSGRGAENDLRWDPLRAPLDWAALAALGPLHAVVHLAGEPLAKRWTPSRKALIRSSRVQGTGQLAEACARLAAKPTVLVSASAVGIYGSRGDDVLDETSVGGDDFLSTVGREWEGAAAPAREAGIRVVHPRTGVVLHPSGGALGKLILPFQLGVGGRMGPGTQWMSWISRTDWVRAVRFLIEAPSVSGPVNLTAPEPATNATFTATLGRVLRRPTVMPVPTAALQFAFGEMATWTILASQRALPRVLERAGFQWKHPALTAALRAELGLA